MATDKDILLQAFRGAEQCIRLCHFLTSGDCLCDREDRIGCPILDEQGPGRNQRGNIGHFRILENAW